ncbi:hypothetical protein PanWU01x14_262710, partial [Parasponia andersonii]
GNDWTHRDSPRGRGHEGPFRDPRTPCICNRLRRRGVDETHHPVLGVGKPARGPPRSEVGQTKGCQILDGGGATV